LLPGTKLKPPTKAGGFLFQNQESVQDFIQGKLHMAKLNKKAEHT